MGQAASLEVIAAEAQALGLGEVEAVFLNQAQVVSTFEYLGSLFGGPAVQDPDDGGLWFGFGLGYNGAIVVDRDGKVFAQFASVTLPDDGEAITAALQEALEQQ